MFYYERPKLKSNDVPVSDEELDRYYGRLTRNADSPEFDAARLLTEMQAALEILEVLSGRAYSPQRQFNVQECLRFIVRNCYSLAQHFELADLE